jgi:hypothetical protein
MPRLLAVLLVSLIVATGPIHTRAAQDGTPAIDTPDGPPRPGVGDRVRIVKSDGAELGAVTVIEIEDPYQGEVLYDAPDPDVRLVFVGVTVENTATRGLDFFAHGFFAVGHNGISYEQSILIANDPRPTFPDSFVPLEPGASESGFVLFEVPDGIDLAQILYDPFIIADTQDELFEEDIRVVAFDRRSIRPGFGDAVQLVGGDGTAIAVASAVDLMDPYPGADSRYLPEGSRMVGVTVAFEVVSGWADLEPSLVALVDSDGSVRSPTQYGPIVVPRTEEAEAAQPAFPYFTLQVGQEAVGFVGFVLPEGIDPVAVAISGDPFGILESHFVYLAEVGAAPTDPLSKLTPASGAPQAEPTEATVATTPDCEDAVAWAEEFAARSEEFLDNLPDDDFDDVGALDPAGRAQAAAENRAAAADLRAMADALAASDPPEVARATNDVFVRFFDEAADGADAIADAIESGDQAQIDAVFDALMGLAEEVGSIFEELLAACPELEDIMA